MLGDEADFGSYLVAVEERDVDLLLMEEFHVSESFVNWFAQQAGLQQASFRGAWHSVSNTDGTDLLLRVCSGDQRRSRKENSTSSSPASALRRFIWPNYRQAVCISTAFLTRRLATGSPGSTDPGTSGVVESCRKQWVRGVAATRW